MNQIAERPMTYTMANGDEMRLTFNMVRNYLVTGRKELVTEQELMFFMHECKARKLNPFLRQCWLIKYSEKEAAQIVESIHHKRAKAMAHPTCEGWERGIIIQTKDGEIKRTKGLIGKDETLIGAYFSATPKGWKVPYELEINLDGYIKKTRDGAVTAFWSKEKQPSQLMKVVESQGLSALWGGEASANTIIEEEANNDEDVIDVSPDDKAVNTSAFDNMVSGKSYDAATFNSFLEETAKANGTSVDQLKLVASTSFDRFWASFEAYSAKNRKRDSLDPALLSQIKAAFETDPAAAKSLLIEIGTDNHENMSHEQAERFLLRFDEMNS